MTHMLDSYSVNKVTSENLFLIVQFLGDAFKFNSFTRLKIYDYLIASNHNLGFYGYSLYFKNCLVGAILTPRQGLLLDKNLEVINLMALYVIPSQRKHGAIYFFRHVITLLSSNYILTDYKIGRASCRERV